MTRQGRPRSSLGLISEAVLTLAATRPVTSLDVARELQLSRPVARSTITRLHSIGHLRAVGQVRIDGGTRPLRQLVAVQQRITGVDEKLATLSSWVHQVRAAVTAGGES